MTLLSVPASALRLECLSLPHRRPCGLPLSVALPPSLLVSGYQLIHQLRRFTLRPASSIPPYAPHSAMPYEEKLALDNVPVKYSTESMYAVWPTGSFDDESAWDARNSKIQLRFYRRFVRFERGWDNKERMVAACVILVCLFCPCPCPCRSLGRRWCAHCVCVHLLAARDARLLLPDTPCCFTSQGFTNILPLHTHSFSLFLSLGMDEWHNTAREGRYLHLHTAVGGHVDGFSLGTLQPN